MGLGARTRRRASMRAWPASAMRGGRRAGASPKRSSCPSESCGRLGDIGTRTTAAGGDRFQRPGACSRPAGEFPRHLPGVLDGRPPFLDSPFLILDAAAALLDSGIFLLDGPSPLLDVEEARVCVEEA